MRRGTVEAIIMRSSDLLLAFPGLLLAIIATAMFGATTLTAMVGIGLANVPGFARISRAAALTVMSLDYVRPPERRSAAACTLPPGMCCRTSPG